MRRRRRPDYHASTRHPHAVAQRIRGLKRARREPRDEVTMLYYQPSSEVLVTGRRPEPTTQSHGQGSPSSQATHIEALISSSRREVSSRNFASHFLFPRDTLSQPFLMRRIVAGQSSSASDERRRGSRLVSQQPLSRHAYWPAFAARRRRRTAFYFGGAMRGRAGVSPAGYFARYAESPTLADICRFTA